jgi:hypothetical protein
LPAEPLNSSTDGAELTLQPTAQLAIADSVHTEDNNPIEAIEERFRPTDTIEETMPGQETVIPLPRVAATPIATTAPIAVTTKRKYQKRNEPPRQTPRPIRTKRQPDWLVPCIKRQKLESSPAKASGNQAGTSGTTTAETRRNSSKSGITVSKVSLKKAKNLILKHQVRRHKLATMEEGQ